MFRNGQIVEEFPDLVVDAASSQDLFDTVNTRSVYVVALDPSLGGATPAAGSYVLPPDSTGVEVPVDGAADTLLTLLPEPGSIRRVSR